MNRFESRRGQVTTEYILLAAFLVTLLMAISGILNSFVQQAGEEIETRASEVMSQRQMGIPLSWFFNKPPGTLPDAGAPGAGEGAGGGSGDGGAGGGANLAGGAGGGSGPGMTGGGPGGTDDATNADSPSASTAGAAGAADSSTNDGDAGRGRRGRRGSTGGVVEVDDDSDGESDDKDRPKNENKADDDKKNQGGSSLDGATRREYALTNESERRGGSCEDFDLFRMLKILAIVALIVLGGAYLVSASGNRGGNKK
ncbi:MAG TPA: hypothetical protein VM901_00905 [Bdellovibrionota bacterium]|nr:hypothetical protein [Bdellovibrionota bacterium]